MKTSSQTSPGNSLTKAVTPARIPLAVRPGQGRLTCRKTSSEAASIDGTTRSARTRAARTSGSVRSELLVSTATR